MRCSGPRLVEVRVRTRLAVSRGDDGASCAAVCWSATDRSALLSADVFPVREEVGSEVEAWGKSKLPVVKGKFAGGGGDGDEGGLGMGDVGARSH